MSRSARVAVADVTVAVTATAWPRWTVPRSNVTDEYHGAACASVGVVVPPTTAARAISAMKTAAMARPRAGRRTAEAAGRKRSPDCLGVVTARLSLAVVIDLSQP